MASVSRTILEALLTTLEGIDGSGTYNNTLATGQVVLGETGGSPPVTNRPYIEIWPAGDDASEEIAIDWYYEQFNIGIRAFACSTTTTDRILNCLDLISDIKQAVRSDTSLLVRSDVDVIVTAGEVYHGEEQLEGWGICELLLVATYQTQGAS